MAHELEQFTDGSASMFSHREIPWHKLGVVVDEAPNAAEALKLARLDWDVTLEPVYAMTSGGMIEIEGRKASVRPHPETGDPDVLGVVGSSYQPVQNAEAFTFLDSLVAESAEPIRFETAGSLRNGRSVFMTMRVPRDVVLDSNGAADSTAMYLMATTSHDGTESFRVAVTPVRVVCMNTLVAGLRQAQRTWSVRHTTSATSRIQEARKALDLTFAYVDAFEAEARKLYETPVTDSRFAQLVRNVFPIKTDVTDRKKKSIEDKRDRVLAIWNGETQTTIKGTAWGAYNAVAEWADYDRRVNGDGSREADRRLVTNLEGVGAAIKQRTWELVGNIAN